MIQEDNIQGHARSFVASYAKDIVTAKIKAGELKEEPEILAEFSAYADAIYKWCLQDLEKPMTDPQYVTILNMMEMDKGIRIPPEAIKRINLNIKGYTVGQASQVIEKLKEYIGQMPPEYETNIAGQGDAMKATKSRTQREP